MAALGRDREAQAAYEEARELASQDPLPVCSLGVLAENRGEMETALRFYQRSVELDSGFENGYFNLATTLANLNRLDEAIATLNKLLELSPEAQDAKKILRQIETARAASP